jgi:arylformamidase
MSELIDISVRLRPEMPIWPGSPGVHVTLTRSMDRGDPVTETRLDIDVHCGTHVEGPMHLMAGGAPVQAFPLSAFVGPAWVADLQGTRVIGSDALAEAGIPTGVERLLVRTANSDLWANDAQTFQADFAALTADGATWVVDRGIRLIGLDYLSVQLFEDDPETHRILMRSGVAILEGLNLIAASPGMYRLTCLPLSLDATEAAPARAMLEPLP